jgi:hypothetical protein
VIFKEKEKRLQLTIHKEHRLKTIKKILVTQYGIEKVWFRCKLNENLYGNESRLADLPSLCELIEFESFEVKTVNLIFQYANGCFKMEFENTLEFGKIENDLRTQIGIGDDVEFQDSGDRKISKYEVIQGLEIIKLARFDKFMKKEICKFVNLRLKLRIGNHKFETTFRCFDGWNKIGIMSHIGKMFGLKYGYIEFSLTEN